MSEQAVEPVKIKKKRTHPWRAFDPAPKPETRVLSPSKFYKGISKMNRAR